MTLGEQFDEQRAAGDYVLEDFVDVLKASLDKGTQRVQGIRLEKFRDFAQGDYRNYLPEYETSRSHYQELYIRNNVIGQCLRRIIAKALRYEPDISVTPRGYDGEQGLPQVYDDVQRMLRRWFADSDGLGELKKALNIILWGGRCYLRLVIPEVYQQALENPRFVPNLTTMLEAIHLQVVDPLRGGAIKSSFGVIEGYYYAYTQRNTPMLEVHTRQHIYQVKRGSLEVVRVDANPFYSTAAIRKPHFMMLELGSYTGEPAFASDTISLQEGLNQALTNGGRNSRLHAHQQIILKNVYSYAQSKLEEAVENAEAQQIEFWTRQVARETYEGGAGTVWNLVGTPNEHEVHSMPGVDVITGTRYDINFSPEIAEYTNKILEHFSQTFIVGEQKAVSAISKKESREQYEVDVKAYTNIIQQGLRLLLPNVLELAFKRASNVLDDYTVNVKVKADIPNGNMDVYKALVDVYLNSDGEAISLETVLEECPVVENVDEERKRIEAERLGRLEVAEQAQDLRLSNAVANGLVI